MFSTRMRVLTCGLILFFLGAACALVQGELAVSFLDVDQGEAALLQGPGFTILIDAGDCGRDDLLPQLRAWAVEKIDLLILTHPHADHIGQAPAVLATYPADEVWMSGFMHTTELFADVLEAVGLSGAAYYEPRRGECFSFGDLVLEILHPQDPLGAEMHRACLALRAVYGEVAFLFTADLERETEEELLSCGLPLRAQILQVAHHGSRTSSGIEFLLAVRPEVAVYSAGWDNVFGHPHPEVVARFRALGIPLYGTDRQGTVTVLTDGKTYKVRTAGGNVSERAPLPGGRVDLNRASAQELERIIHIGPVRAAEIIRQRSLRPFQSVQDLSRVSGLGPARIADIEEQGLAYVGE